MTRPMSLKANYFKLGLFVIGAIAAGIVVLIIIGSGRWFQKRITIETYFNESVQGLDIGSKLKYRGVAIGEVTRIGFTYNKYQLDRPMAERARYVLVEAQLEPRLLGGRAGAGDLTSTESAGQEVERGLRVRLAPLGITGTSYLEVDYMDPPPPTLQIDWTPDFIYIPSARSTVTAIVNAASEIMERLHKLDIEGTLANLNKLMVTANARIEAVDAKGISDRASRALGKLETTLDNIDSKKLSNEAIALMAEVRASNAELKKVLANPSFQKLPDETLRGDRARADARRRPEPRQERAEPLAHAGAARPHPRRRRGRSLDDAREPAPDHRQPARPDRRCEALSGERASRRAAATARRPDHDRHAPQAVRGNARFRRRSSPPPSSPAAARGRRR